MFSKFKSKIGHAKLKKQYKKIKRDKRIHNLVSARRIGVIFYAMTDKDFKLALDFVNFLSEQNLEVCLLAYYPGKEIPQEFLMRKGANLFSKKEVNWYGKPLAPFTEEFAKMDFDILIDLSMEEVFPLKWVATLSVAKFKVSSLMYPNPPYDLLINVKQTDSLEYYISQVKHYLNLINNRFAQEETEDRITTN
ncbi:MAG: DUF6913 domain-containing protein [Bacteroidales bacterium]